MYFYSIGSGENEKLEEKEGKDADNTISSANGSGESSKNVERINEKAIFCLFLSRKKCVRI